MRVLVSTLTPYPSGSAHVVHITATARGFVAAGNDVLLVSAQKGPGWPIGAEGRSAPPELPFRFRALAGRDHRGQSFVNLPRLRRIARRAGPDLCFADDVRAAVALTSCDLPTILEFHTLHFFSSRTSRVALRRVLRAPSLRSVIAISHALADDLAAEAGVPRKLITVVPEAARALTDEQFAGGPPDWLRGSTRAGALQVGFSGSLYAGRGAQLLLEIARRLPHIDLHVVGGPTTAADELRLRPDRPKNLYVHGLRPATEAVELQIAVDVLLAPYSTSVGSPGDVDISRWFSPMKMFEYLASGRPTVCADLPVLREVLTDGETALMVTPDDVDAWVSAIERLRDDRSLRSRLGSQGRALHAERYTWERRTEELLRAAGMSDRSSQDVSTDGEGRP